MSDIGSVDLEGLRARQLQELSQLRMQASGKSNLENRTRLLEQEVGTIDSRKEIKFLKKEIKDIESKLLKETNPEQREKLEKRAKELMESLSTKKKQFLSSVVHSRNMERLNNQFEAIKHYMPEAEVSAMEQTWRAKLSMLEDASLEPENRPGFLRSIPLVGKYLAS